MSATNKYTKDELTTALERAKIALMSKRKSVFLTTILFSLKYKWDESAPTAWTDGLSIGVNPDWFMDLSANERVGLLAHEAWHVAFSHMMRMKSAGFDGLTYNKAADHVINLMLEEAGYELPAGALKDPQYKGMSTEEIYKLIFDKEEKDRRNGKSPDGISGTGDDLRDPNENATPEQAADNSKKIEDTVLKAATQSKMSGEAGSIPGDIERMIHELTHPKLDWRTLFQNYMSAFNKDDFSYKKPNRRFFPDHYLPSAHSEALDEVCFAVDTSGSVTDAQFAAFLTEINSVKEDLQPKLTTIIDFDTSIKHVHSLTPDMGIDTVSFSGWGGTNLEPVFEHYDKKKPTVLVVFSDLFCNPIKEDPGYPVIWACFGNPDAEVNFGQLIHVDFEP